MFVGMRFTLRSFQRLLIAACLGASIVLTSNVHSPCSRGSASTSPDCMALEEIEDTVQLLQNLVQLETMQDASELEPRQGYRTRLPRASAASAGAFYMNASEKLFENEHLPALLEDDGAAEGPSNVTKWIDKALPVHRLHELLHQPLSKFVNEVHAPDEGWAIVAFVLVCFWFLCTVSLTTWYLRKHSHGEPLLECHWTFKVASFVFALVIGIGAAYLVTVYYAGAVVKQLIQNYDESLLGVKVYIGNLIINPFTGLVKAEDLEIENPPGYNSNYLLRAAHVNANLNMLQFILSFQKKIHLDLSITDVRAIYESKLYTSNIEDVLNYIKHPSTGHSAQKSGFTQVQDAKVNKTSGQTSIDAQMGASLNQTSIDAKLGASLNQTSIHAQLGASLNQTSIDAELGASLNQTSIDAQLGASLNQITTSRASQTEVALHKVSVTNCSVRTQLSFINKFGVDWKVPNLKYDDFEKEFGTETVAQIVGILLNTFLASILDVVKQLLGNFGLTR